MPAQTGCSAAISVFDVAVFDVAVFDVGCEGSDLGAKLARVYALHMHSVPTTAANRPTVMARILVMGISLVLLAFMAMPAAAQDTDEVPYWASLTTDKANMRVGPGGSYQIVWVYQRKGLPLKVVRRLSGWRLVEDPDGTRGWLVSRFLSRERTAIVTGDDNVMMRAMPDDGAKLLWQVEPGVTGWLGDCSDGWCRFAVGEREGPLQEGWVPENRLWGPGEP